MPQLEVRDVGRISLPLLPIQAEQLVSVAEQAPYGRGQETLCGYRGKANLAN